MGRARVAKFMSSVTRIVVTILAVKMMNNSVIVVETWIVTTIVVTAVVVVALDIRTGMVSLISHMATIKKSIFLSLIRLRFFSSFIVIEGGMAIEVVGRAMVVMRNAGVSGIVFTIVAVMLIKGSCSIIIEVAWMRTS